MTRPKGERITRICKYCNEEFTIPKHRALYPAKSCPKSECKQAARTHANNGMTRWLGRRVSDGERST